MSTVEDPDDEEFRLHMFTVNDPRLWEFRSRLTAEEFAIPGLTNDEWDSFHAIIAEV